MKIITQPTAIAFSLAVLPATAFAACEPYTVKTGDTLGTIAAEFLGSSNQFEEIIAANPGKFPSGPNVISVGTILDLPCDDAEAESAGTDVAVAETADADPVIAETTDADAIVADGSVSDAVIAEQRAALQASSASAGFGPQSPRDLSTLTGANPIDFGTAPVSTEMNLCNIHFHESAEHRGGQFTTFAGNGNGKGYRTGYVYDGELTAAELRPVNATIGANDYDSLAPGDTIEIHFVHTSAQVTPGPTLGSCLSESIGNPQLRVETVVAVLVNDSSAANMMVMARVQQVNGYYQAPNVPSDLGTPITYAGSTTGPSYNEKASPLQVSWSVRPNVVKMDIYSVDAWLKKNQFEEKYAHGVRNLVVNPDLISSIDQ